VGNKKIEAKSGKMAWKMSERFGPDEKILNKKLM